MARSAPPRSRRERRRVETTARLIAAGRELFAERGYVATRTSDIASRAGVSDATLFRYFESKSAIALASMAESVTFALERLSAQPREVGDLDAARGVSVEFFDAALLDPDDPLMAEIALVGAVPELRAAVHSRISGVAEATARALADRAGRRSPSLADRVHGHAIVGVVVGAAEAWFDDPTDRSFADLLDDAFSMLSNWET